MDPGGCNRAYPAFYYDRTEGRCKPFSYSGCGGNSNRFLTIQQCQRTCAIFTQLTGLQSKCLLPLDVGYGRRDPNCINRAGYMYYFNRHYQKCGRFWYFGCGGNKNKYGTEVECRVTCAHKPSATEPTALVDPRNCYLEEEAGSCVFISNKPSVRWSYSPKSQTCDQFTYNGCGGNGNRFGSKQSCETACGGLKPTKSLMCAAWPDWGPCNRLRWMWHFNMSTGRCEQFLWGGCEGNMNRFTNFHQCQTTCEVPSGSRCTEPLDRGNWCTSMMFRFYFDTTENRCKGFHYTGCGTSRNNFKSLDECQTECMTQRMLRSADPLVQPNGYGEYEHGEPPAKQQMNRHDVIDDKGKLYMKTEPIWVDYSHCIGFRYNISGPGTILHSYLCLMEEGGECISEVFQNTNGFEKCKLLRPWVRGTHMYSWFFTLEKRKPNNWIEHKLFKNNTTEANVMPLGLNRCWDVC